MAHSLRSFGGCGTVALGFLAMVPLITGCGGGEFSTAPASGTVTMNGEPVTGGNIIFTPVGGGDSENPGKGAAAPVQEDGSFVLTTYEEGDGAVIGKHRVSYTPPISTEAAPAGAHGGPPRSPFFGAKPKQQEVEITDGDNTLTIELTK